MLVVGIDVVKERCDSINRGESHIGDIKSDEMAPLVKKGLLSASVPSTSCHKDVANTSLFSRVMATIWPVVTAPDAVAWPSKSVDVPPVKAVMKSQFKITSSRVGAVLAGS